MRLRTEHLVQKLQSDLERFLVGGSQALPLRILARSFMRFSLARTDALQLKTSIAMILLVCSAPFDLLPVGPEP
jgi:hypothetical protein